MTLREELNTYKNEELRVLEKLCKMTLDLDQKKGNLILDEEFFIMNRKKALKSLPLIKGILKKRERKLAKV